MNLSELINQAVREAVREALREAHDDLAVFDEFALEPTLTFEEMLRRLDPDGKI